MKDFLFLLAGLILIVFISGCQTSKKNTSNDTPQTIIIDTVGNQVISITKGPTYNHPSFVIWLEDLKGDYISTIYITKSFASGKYAHQMVNDSLWLNREGPSYQPAALPYWTHKKGLINGNELVPTIEEPFVDAYTGATPTTNFNIRSNSYSKLKDYTILLETNQLGDWNEYWTNSKYPMSNAYKNSAQPSLVYAVTINNNNLEFYLNPIGHGDPIGISGKLFTNISTLSTAKDIFKDIKVTIK